MLTEKMTMRQPEIKDLKMVSLGWLPGTLGCGGHGRKANGQTVRFKCRRHRKEGKVSLGPAIDQQVPLGICMVLGT